MDTFIRSWPGKLGVCCPLYAKAYSEESQERPFFWEAGRDEPPMEILVTVGEEVVPVEIFEIHGSGQTAHVTYFMVHADCFRGRSKETMFLDKSEHEELKRISVFSQATSYVLLKFQYALYFLIIFLLNWFLSVSLCIRVYLYMISWLNPCRPAGFRIYMDVALLRVYICCNDKYVFQI